MSTCISKHGEFGWHERQVDFVCDYCGEFDQDAALSALNEATAKVARVEALADEWERTTTHRWPSIELRAVLAGDA